MKVRGDKITLSTGRTFYAHGGILSVPADVKLKEPALSYGWDGGVDEEDDFTPAERREIARAMIGAWKRWSGLR